MKTTLTVTSKGQTTIPAPIRHKLGLSESGGLLQMNFNEDKDELIISRPLSVNELSSKISNFINPGIKPLTDVDAFYQANRGR